MINIWRELFKNVFPVNLMNYVRFCKNPASIVWIKEIQCGLKDWTFIWN